MRYDVKVMFHTSGNGNYNPDTGEYESCNDKFESVLSNVTDVGLAQSMQLFGSINQSVKIVRPIKPVPNNWDYAIIAGDKNHYVLKSYRETLKGRALVLGETQ